MGEVAAVADVRQDVDELDDLDAAVEAEVPGDPGVEAHALQPVRGGGSMGRVNGPAFDGLTATPLRAL